MAAAGPGSPEPSASSAAARSGSSESSASSAAARPGSPESSASEGPESSASSEADAQEPRREVTIEEKGRRVISWLKKLYQNEPIPEYKVSERTVALLYGLAEINEGRDRDVSLLIKEMELQAREYKKEANYLQGVLEDCLGLSIYSLPSKVNKHLGFLVESARILKTKDTSLTRLFCAINDMSAELYVRKYRNRKMGVELRNLHQSLTGALVLQEQLKTDLKNTEQLLEEEHWRSEIRSPQLKFLEDKAYELGIRVQIAEEQLLAQGWDKSLTHESLFILSETLARLQEEDACLKHELENYQGLPLHPLLAKVRIEEVRREVNALEEEFSKYITALSIELQEYIRPRLT